MSSEQERHAAIAACRKSGADPFEVIPVGPCTRMSGDLLTDGLEVERWVLELPEARQRACGLR